MNNNTHLSLYYIDNKMLLEIRTRNGEDWDLVEKTWDVRTIAKYIKKLPKNVKKTIYHSNILDLFFEDDSSITIYNYPAVKNKLALASLKGKVDKFTPKSKKGFYASTLVALGIMSGISGVTYSSQNVGNEVSTISSDVEMDEEMTTVSSNDIKTGAEDTTIEDVEYIDKDNTKKINFDGLDIEGISFNSLNTTTAYNDQEIDKMLAINGIGNDNSLENENPSYNFNDVLPSFGDNTNDDRIINVRSKYKDLIDKYATMIGIDPIILECLVAQENGTNEMSDLGAIGCCQIQYNIHVNSTKDLIDVNTGKVHTFCATHEVLSSYEGSFMTAASILQQSAFCYNGNIFMIIQAYNFGDNALQTVLEMASADTGYRVDEFINDSTNLCWVPYLKIYSESRNNYGDPDFLNNVFCFYNSKTLTTNYGVYSGTGENVTYEVSSYQKSMSR